jgi:surface antigen
MVRAVLTAVLAGALAGGALVPSVTAQPYDNRDQRDGSAYDEGYREGYRTGYEDRNRGERYDDHVRRIGDAGPDRNERWRERYSRSYTYNDDSYYQECRDKADPGGVIAGALIGGLLGNAIGSGGGRAPATVAGVIVGGAVGGALTRKLDCGDRSYAYKAYYDGFNSGRPGSDYEWRNSSNGHYGQFRVGEYYNDPDGFRCATYTQRVYIDGQPQSASGRACQQPDGSWSIIE